MLIVAACSNTGAWGKPVTVYFCGVLWSWSHVKPLLPESPAGFWTPAGILKNKSFFPFSARKHVRPSRMGFSQEENKAGIVPVKMRSCRTCLSAQFQSSERCDGRVAAGRMCRGTRANIWHGVKQGWAELGVAAVCGEGIKGLLGEMDWFSWGKKIPFWQQINALLGGIVTVVFGALLENLFWAEVTEMIISEWAWMWGKCIWVNSGHTCEKCLEGGMKKQETLCG